MYAISGAQLDIASYQVHNHGWSLISGEYTAYISTVDRSAFGQMDGPAVEKIILVPNFITGGVVVQKVSSERGGSREPLEPPRSPPVHIWGGKRHRLDHRGRALPCVKRKC